MVTLATLLRELNGLVMQEPRLADAVVVLSDNDVTDIQTEYVDLSWTLAQLDA